MGSSELPRATIVVETGEDPVAVVARIRDGVTEILCEDPQKILQIERALYDADYEGESASERTALDEEIDQGDAPERTALDEEIGYLQREMNPRKIVITPFVDIEPGKSPEQDHFSVNPNRVQFWVK